MRSRSKHLDLAQSHASSRIRSVWTGHSLTVPPSLPHTRVVCHSAGALPSDPTQTLYVHFWYILSDARSGFDVNSEAFVDYTKIALMEQKARLIRLVSFIRWLDAV